MHEIVELDNAGVERHTADLARLLLDAHDANMALGMTAPLTAERAAAAWLDLGAALAPGERILLVALEDGRVLGSVHLARAAVGNGRHRAEVQRLAVRADARGRGLGSELLAAGCERARGLGLTLLWLTTHAGTDSDRFYAARGWERAGVIPAYAQLPDGSLAANAFFYKTL
ncbi:MAG TPA: GNAT family N-acetyltransferase [Gaiellaceae bacterium]|nr:GNAT family N-acetyltransferase [Gaiellaceae bacterium]